MSTKSASQALSFERIRALRMRALGYGVACCACLAVGVGCGDGIGDPIRRAVAEPLAVDSGVDAGVSPRRSREEGRHARVPDGPHCARAATWPEELANSELELFDELNRVRDREGLDCGSREFHDLRPLRFEPELRCSARLHSLDMADRGFFGLSNPEGDDPEARIAAAGLAPITRGITFVARAGDAMSVFEDLLGDRDGCVNFAQADFTSIGIGRYDDLWTIDFATVPE